MLFRGILIVVLFLIDWYVFQAIKLVSKNLSEPVIKSIYSVYWAIGILSISVVIFTAIVDFHLWNKAWRTYLFAFIIIIYWSKILVILFLIIDDLIRLFQWLYFMIDKHFIAPKTLSQNIGGITISRWEFISRLGLVVAAIPFASLVYGMLGNAYNYQVRKVKLRFPNLPDTFNGLKIIQLSDIHIGSFSSSEPIRKAIQLIKEQKPDMILFTGDLVNDKADEIDEFFDTLKEIQAPLGVFSVLGNHDYGDYATWQSQQAKKENLDRLKSLQKELGWTLLLNEHAHIERNNEKLTLIGVENWSAMGRFSKHGDMQKATANMGATSLKILLSHDPSHWSAEILEKYPDIALTLSGHTHGMQFGVDIPGFRWSPVKYVYKNWIDLYQHKNQYLYVNRGFGFIGYPGRVGILPEITVFELMKG